MSVVVGHIELGSKIEPPAPPAGFVPRKHLRVVLDGATAGAAVTMVCAPAGTGKTVLLAEWARTRSAPTAWVSVDPDDNRPGGLWSAVAHAVARCVPALADLLVGPTAVGDRTGVRHLLVVLDALPGELRLVLDDVHELTSPAVLGELLTMIRYSPARLRLVLAGRRPPALPLSRLRLQGGVVDLGADQLGLSLAETAALISRCGAVMSPEQVSTTHVTTGGWAEGIRLTALAAGRSGDVRSSAGTISGAEHAIAEYLEEEVLGSLSAADRSFLLDVSVCDAVAPSLAAQLSGRSEAGRVLERLVHETSLVSGPEDGRFRLQPLVRSSLSGELGRRQPARGAQLHLRAARWCAVHARPFEAIVHARSSGRTDEFIALVRRWAMPLVLAGEHDSLRLAGAILGPARVADDGVLRLVLPVLDDLAGDPAAVSLRGALTAGATEFRALRAVGDLAASITGGVEGSGPRARLEGALAEAIDGATRLFVSGDRSGAVVRLEAVSARAVDLGLDHLAMQCSSLLATAAAVVGDAVRMTSHATEAISLSERGGWGVSAWSVAARSALAYGGLLGARPDDARRHAADLLAHAPGSLHPAQELLLTVLGAAAESDAGRMRGGLHRMQQARVGFADRELTGAQAALVAVLEHETALALGHAAHARAARRWLEVRVGRSGDVAVMAAREALAADPSVLVGHVVAPVVARTTPALLPDVEIEAVLLGVRDALLTQDRARARRLLVDALDRAAPLDLMRPFTHASASVREVMAHQLGSFGSADGFARRALVAGVQGRATSRAGLSGRESTILRLLPSLSTTGEIADDLHVSLNTIKSQIGAIYSKLGVNNRRAAVVAAYDAGLLGDVTRTSDQDSRTSAVG
ncbi:helix-turn-helix transcriptional regulator [Actinomycetospora sp.]|uniref:helix-turn-helix transcriptional regulator n=1 Tax=Actinomycetospora sp. TaxID=1872135 RepID=UPI002F3FA8D9